MHRRLSILLICLAGFVLTLHNITPHAHDDPVTRENSSDPESLLEWLYFAFQIDPGAGHLECFSKPDQLGISGENLTMPPLLANISQENDAGRTTALGSLVPSTTKGIPPDKDFLPCALSLRGPPMS